MLCLESAGTSSSLGININRFEKEMPNYQRRVPEQNLCHMMWFAEHILITKQGV